MNFEKPKIENVESKDGKTERAEKLKKKIREMTAWGVITLSSLGILKTIEKVREQEYKPKAIIADIEKKQSLSEIEKAELNKKLEYLKNNFSENIFSQLKNGAETNKESKPEPIEVKGFERVGFSNEDLKELWSEKYYPKGWLDDEINVVEYRDKELKGDLKREYGRDEEVKYGGTTHMEKEGKSKIEFYFKGPKEHDSKKDFIETLDWYFSHEASHANDWESESQMDFKNRVDFLCEVSQSCFKGGAFRDVMGYVDSIKNNDKNKERYYKVREYWGSCCEYYFTFPEIFKQNNPAEFAMVDKYVKMEDTNYNPVEKLAQRKGLIEQMSDKQVKN